MMTAKQYGLCGVHLKCAADIGYVRFKLDQIRIKHSIELAELSDRIMGNVTSEDSEYDSLIEQLEIAKDEMRINHDAEKRMIEESLKGYPNPEKRILGFQNR